MIQWIKGVARDFIRWMKTRNGRIVASVGCLIIITVAAFKLGGIVASAVLITLSVYVGTMVTLNRMRRPPPEDASKFWKMISAPLQKLADFFFKHRLITTIVLGTLATSMIGMSTVTGIAVAALSALAGDPLVTAIIDIADWVNEIEVEEKEVEVAA